MHRWETMTNLNTCISPCAPTWANNLKTEVLWKGTEDPESTSHMGSSPFCLNFNILNEPEDNKKKQSTY